MRVALSMLDTFVRVRVAGPWTWRAVMADLVSFRGQWRHARRRLRKPRP